MKFAPSLATLVAGAAFLNALSDLLPSVYAAEQHPSHTVTYFENLPQRLYYFDDTTTVLYHDAVAGNVYISGDEGKSWNLVKDVPKAAADQLVEHPFDTRYAFILTTGTKHYRTKDRGQTWHPFEVPIPPVVIGSPLSFHADPKKVDYILYQGTKCENTGLFFRTCHDETYHTREAFGDEPKKMLDQTSKCVFAHSSKDFKHDAPSDLVFCIAWEAANKEGTHSIETSRLIASTDYFKDDRQVIDFGIGTRLSRGVVALGVVSKFMVVALKDLSSGNNGEMVLYVTVDAKTWAKAHFPHGSNSKLVENSYTIVESTTHSLAIDVQSHASRGIGTLFVSNSNGTFFVESLKDTHRSDVGYVDFEEFVGIDGVGLANYVANARQVDGGKAKAKLKSVITYDDGSSWEPIRPPEKDMHGQNFKCSSSKDDQCSLHLHSVSTPHNVGRVFSSLAPGYAMGVGSVGEYLEDYENSDLYLSTDAGRSWIQVHHGAHKYEFGDQGNVMVIINDEEVTDAIRYSIDGGKTWRKYDLTVKVRARLLTTIPDSTSQKFVLIGSLARKDVKPEGKHVVVFLDFASMRDRQCQDGDFEKWYARGKGGHECIMGHKQWYNRRKQDADCFVGNKFRDPVVHEENCPCQKSDYECDFNYVREGNDCVPVGPEPIPAGVCENERKDEKYTGSSGYRLVPGNTCKKDGGIVLDKPVEKPCSQAERPEGQVAHQIFKFDAPVFMISYFKKSPTLLVQLFSGDTWQSRNEGFTWKQIKSTEVFTSYYMHSHSNDRAFLITLGTTVYYTTDGARSWNTLKAPLPPNGFNIPLISFHPQRTDWLIWVGETGCTDTDVTDNCRAEAYYTTDNGRGWTFIEKYVRQCSWARDNELKIDEKLILCESYRDKKGNQGGFGYNNPLELVIGGNYFTERKRLFEQVVGFATFSEYLLVAEVPLGSSSLDLQISLNGNIFAKGLFPPDMRLDNRAYTILESSTDAVFLHVTMSSEKNAEWGNLLKSNSNGTYYGLSLDHVNRNTLGYVDFEKVVGIDGVAIVNILTNPEEAARTGRKKLRTRISHNDGGTWRSINPPATDSNGNKYECNSAKCALHIHGFTERRDPRAVFSSPSVVGLMLGVGNVGESLAPYRDSDTFLTRDAGFTWEEVHKDAHMWEFGDSGSIIVIVNDEEPVDHVQYTLDEGKSWREYKFGERLRVTSLTTVPEDNSRKFLLIGYPPREEDKARAVYLDFSSVNKRQCVLKTDDPAHDDFELWSPSEEREEPCLFGRQTLYHRRIRDAKCFIGQLEKPPPTIQKNCTCKEVDFECEYNHVRNSAGECALVSGAQPLPNDDSCPGGADFWYERTAYRKIPKSSCEGGKRPDRGVEHTCPGFRAHNAGFWLTILSMPFGFTALVAFWYYRRSGYRRGTIRLSDRYAFSDSGPLSTLLSIPWFIVGVAGVAWSYVERLPFIPGPLFRSRRGYRHVPVDEDAQVLRFEDED